jgi:hypothetical protein
VRLSEFLAGVPDCGSSWLYHRPSVSNVAAGGTRSAEVVMADAAESLSDRDFGRDERKGGGRLCHGDELVSPDRWRRHRRYHGRLALRALGRSRHSGTARRLALIMAEKGRAPSSTPLRRRVVDRQRGASAVFRPGGQCRSRRLGLGEPLARAEHLARQWIDSPADTRRRPPQGPSHIRPAPPGSDLG